MKNQTKLPARTQTVHWGVRGGGLEGRKVGEVRVVGGGGGGGGRLRGRQIGIFERVSYTSRAVMAVQNSLVFFVQVQVEFAGHRLWEVC